MPINSRQCFKVKNFFQRCCQYPTPFRSFTSKNHLLYESKYLPIDGITSSTRDLVWKSDKTHKANHVEIDMVLCDINITLHFLVVEFSERNKNTSKKVNFSGWWRGHLVLAPIRVRNVSMHYVWCC